MLPVYPALALLAGRALTDAAAGARRHWSDFAAWSIWGVVALGLGGVLFFLPARLGAAVPFLGVLAVAGALAIAGATLLGLSRGRTLPWLALGAAILIWASGFGLIMPRIDALWLSRGAAALVNDRDRVLRPVVVAGYAEPSIVFLLGTATKLANGPEAAVILSKLPQTLVLVGNREDAAFRAALKKDGISVDSLGQVSGFDYSNGRAVTLTLYETAR